MNYKARVAIWERDQRICGLCGQAVALEHLEVDHIIARMRGGSDDPANLQASHKACNRAKQHVDQRLYGRPRRVRQSIGQVNIRLAPRGNELLSRLRAKLNLGTADVVRLALARLAEHEGIEVARDA